MSAAARRAEFGETLRLGEVLEFLRTLWALDQALHHASKRMQRTVGVTGPQRLVLRMVGRFPSIQAGELARLLHIHPSTLTGILKRLERRKLLVRRPHPRDRRRVLRGLTVDGRRIAVKQDGTIEAAVRTALAALPAVQIRATEDALSRIRLALESAAPARAA